jgi:putative peptidoglycan lipid II flippase
MNKIVKVTKSLIFSQQKTIFSSAILIAATIVVARFFGFLRFRVLASYFPKEQLDIFFASFRIPDIIFEILITGALTSSFIPIFIKYKDNPKELRENISSIINLIFLILFLIILTLSLFLKKIVLVITPGFSPQKVDQITFFSSILLFGQLPFLILGNFLTGIGQANKIFFLPSIAPIFYNLAIIITTIFLHQLGLLAPVMGVVFGSLTIFLIQIPLLFFDGFFYQLVLKINAAVKEFLQMAIPRILTVIVSQIDATIDLTLSTFLKAGSYTAFYLAQHLQLLPVSIIGMAWGQASLPYLSDLVKEKKEFELKQIVEETILCLLFLSLPFAIFFIFGRTPLVRLFFGGEKFDWEATVVTAKTLSYFALGLPFHTLYYFLTRCFYAFLDTKTPFLIGLFSIIVNTFFSVFFIFFLKLPVFALALSFSLAIILNTLSLFLFLTKKIKNINYSYLIGETLKIFTAALIASLPSYLFLKVADPWIFNTIYTINVFFLLFSVALIYFFWYLFFSWVLDVKQLYLFTKLIGKAKEYQKKIIELFNQYD